MRIDRSFRDDHTIQALTKTIDTQNAAIAFGEYIQRIFKSCRLIEARLDGKLVDQHGNITDRPTASFSAWQPIETAPFEYRMRVKWCEGQIHIARRRNGLHEIEWETEQYCPPDCTPPEMPTAPPDFWAPLE